MFFEFYIVLLQVKYKEDGKKEMSINLYSLLPETIDTQHAKEVSKLASQVTQTHSYPSCTELVDKEPEPVHWCVNRLGKHTLIRFNSLCL